MIQPSTDTAVDIALNMVQPSTDTAVDIALNMVQPSTDSCGHSTEHGTAVNRHSSCGH